jgi:serine/threonine-protein kinase
MGEVRRVLDTSLDRTLAMKIMSTALLTRPEAAASFLAEARQTAQLEHPGIVPVHEIGRLEDGRLFFTMKEVKGRTLPEMLQERAQGADGILLRRLVDVFHRVCEAVAYAHAKGVVHRDLKPDNVMVGAFGEVLVLDWGIAARVDQPLEPGGRVPGTPEYMSPEAQQGGGVADPRSDVWALGVVLREVLGAAPGAPVPQDAPPELAALVSETAGPPAQRPRDAAALAERVEAWLEGARRRDRADEHVQRARTGSEGSPATSATGSPTATSGTVRRWWTAAWRRSWTSDPT